MRSPWEGLILFLHEIESRVRRGVPEGTKKATTFAPRVYEEWVTARSEAFPENQLPSLSDLPTVSKDIISRTLCYLVFEIRRKVGKEYPPARSRPHCVSVSPHASSIQCIFYNESFFQTDCLIAGTIPLPSLHRLLVCALLTTVKLLVHLVSK